MQNHKFILVDDDKLVLTFSRMLIKKNLGDVEVQAFTEAEVALQYLKSAPNDAGTGQPAVLLLDINMPTMTGWEFLEHFHSLGEEAKRHIKIFILSSSVDGRDVERARNDHHVVDFLVKPLSRKALDSIANGVLVR
jgi:CheY-like chemotaxis protein